MLITIIVTLVVVGVLLYLIDLLPMDATIKRIIYVLVILFVFLYVLQMFGVISGVGTPLRINER